MWREAHKMAHACALITIRVPLECSSSTGGAGGLPLTANAWCGARQSQPLGTLLDRWKQVKADTNAAPQGPSLSELTQGQLSAWLMRACTAACAWGVPDTVWGVSCRPSGRMPRPEIGSRPMRWTPASRKEHAGCLPGASDPHLIAVDVNAVA